MTPNQKKNIALLCISLNSGGAEKVVSLLLAKLKEDYNVSLVLFYDDIHFPIPDEVDVTLLSKKKPNRPYFLRFLDFIRFIIKYQKIIKRENIGISISFLAFPNLINGIISIFYNGVNTIISERGFPSDNTTSKTSLFISKLFYPIFYNKCDKLFSNSVYINSDLKENFGIKIPMEVIYNPITIPRQRIDSKSLNTHDPLQIITAGTLNKRKNQIMMIRAVSLNPNNDKLSILGNGPLKSYLYSEIEKHKLSDRVKLLGTVKNVNEYFIASNCFILTSFTEGFPNALLEAMAIGLPCISTNCLSGPLELLNNNEEIKINEGDFYLGKFGILINNNDHVGLRKALDYYRNNPSEREKYSKLSLQRSELYSLPVVYKKFNQFITN
ncbi:glycosyltransferase [Winogradskyella vincentii]|uniref:Glycosyltransferase n=1 Tax=Winogradskyella vincentii TaxID=2877122 RepID=A0ABS7XZ99_9FLAO|nr:glycosyltransferase [Winogradskyella vincentii]MCA0152994.1 glycosyltransferase [Winogradskyella vincentii]